VGFVRGSRSVRPLQTGCPYCRRTAWDNPFGQVEGASVADPAGAFLGVHDGTKGDKILFVQTEDSECAPGEHGGAFPTTLWGVVQAAGHPSAAVAQPALEQLCRSYWYPLYAHVRRRGYAQEDAEDLTQAFFARLLTHESLRRADSGRGRFRCFLLAALNHFLAHEWNKARAQKRGGDRSHLAFDTAAGEQLYDQEGRRELNPEELYERSWALQFLDHVRARVRQMYAEEGKADRYQTLERFLPGEEDPPSYAEAAAQLGVPEGTVKSEVHRLKRRYGELLREEVAHTVASPGQIDDELHYLIRVLGR
jgi:RNA polymerase sigma factor (sigma-70 family)